MLQSANIKVMSDAALKVGRMLLRDFGEVENLQVSMKGPGDFVTAADKKAETILIRELTKVRPDYGFLLEESGEIEGKSKEFRWVIDPLDGTTNFLHGFPHFCTSIALEKINPSGKAEIISAVIHSPLQNEIFCAEKGLGAFLNGYRMEVSKRSNMQEVLVATGGGRGSDALNAENISALNKAGGSVRIAGAAALELAYVAAGRLDGFWHRKLKRWDLAAGMLLVKEARGQVTSFDGGSEVLETGNIVATNGHIHEKICKIIK